MKKKQKWDPSQFCVLIQLVLMVRRKLPFTAATTIVLLFFFNASKSDIVQWYKFLQVGVATYEWKISLAETGILQLKLDLRN